MCAGGQHACAVLADHTLRCWGGADGLQLGGAGNLLQPTEVPGLTGVVDTFTVTATVSLTKGVVVRGSGSEGAPTGTTE